jgi:hypothetical protein
MLRSAREIEKRRKAPGPWVVTYHADLEGVLRTMEWYRGDKAECFRIANAFGGWGEDDKRRNKDRWSVQLGPAAEWDEFLGDMEA